MNPAIIGGIVRAILAAIGGGSAAGGWLTDDVIAQLTGALTVALSAWWSWHVKTHGPKV